MSYVKISGVYRRRSKRSNIRKRRVLAFAAVVTLATLVAWLWNDGKGGDAGPRVAAATASRPVAVAAPWSAAQLRSLDSRLTGAFAPALDGAAGWSLAVVDARGKTLLPTAPEARLHRLRRKSSSSPPRHWQRSVRSIVSKPFLPPTIPSTTA